MTKMTRFALCVFASCALATNTSNSQTRFSDPQQTLQNHFWGNLYQNGGVTFFCNKAFSKKSILLTESYIYSTSWMRDHLRCGTPRQCRDHNEQYRRMTSDLHNIYPADTRIELERRNARFEELPDSIAADDCGQKRSFQIIEPADDRKGDIARILLYMSETYELPIMGNLNQLKRWSREDPPSDAERERNVRVREIQGNENRFITSPSAVQTFGN